MTIEDTIALIDKLICEDEIAEKAIEENNGKLQKELDAVKASVKAIDRFLYANKLYISDDLYDESEVKTCISVMIHQMKTDFCNSMVHAYEF